MRLHQAVRSACFPRQSLAYKSYRSVFISPISGISVKFLVAAMLRCALCGDDFGFLCAVDIFCFVSGNSFLVPKYTSTPATLLISAACISQLSWQTSCTTTPRVYWILKKEITNMKNTKVLTSLFAAVFFLSLTASAQLGLGGAVKGTVGAVGNVGGQRGSLNGDLNSATQIGGGLQNGANGSLDSTTQAAAKADKKKKDQQAAATGNDRKSQKPPLANAETAVESSTQAAVQGGQQMTSSSTSQGSQSAGSGNSSQTAIGLNTKASVNAGVGGNSASADANSNTSANTDAQHHGKSGSAQTQANSSASGQAKASHPQKAHDKEDKK